jgi:hypothetical protein
VPIRAVACELAAACTTYILIYISYVLHYK